MSLGPDGKCQQDLSEELESSVTKLTKTCPSLNPVCVSEDWQVVKPAHNSSWGKSGPVGSTSDLLIWLSAVGSVAGRPKFSTLVIEPASNTAAREGGKAAHRQCRVSEPWYHWSHHATSSLRENRELLLPIQRCSQDPRAGGCIGCRVIPPGTWSRPWGNGTPNKCKNAWQ